MSLDQTLRAKSRRPDTAPTTIDMRRMGVETRWTDERLDAHQQAVLESALEHDHISACAHSDNNTCDINAAYDAGFPEVAAHLLLNATECERTSAVILGCGTECDEHHHRDEYDHGPGLDIYGRRPWAPDEAYPWPRGWGAWTEHFAANTAECPECASYVWLNGAERDTCDSCHATVRGPSIYCDSESGAEIVTVPWACVVACSGPGAADEPVRRWIADEHSLTWHATPETIRKSLAGHGAWDDDELADDETNRERILWIACNDIRENPDEYAPA